MGFRRCAAFASADYVMRIIGVAIPSPVLRMATAPTDAATAASAQKPDSREPAVAPIPSAAPFAALPPLAPTIPAAGQRVRLAELPESGDSLALAPHSIPA